MEERARGRVEDGLRVSLQSEQGERGDGAGGRESEEVAPEGLGGGRAEEACVEEGGLLGKVEAKSGGGMGVKERTGEKKGRRR